MESKEQTAVQVAETSTPTSSSWLNFNVIHIIVEVAALCGIAVYFTNKINGLQKQVQDLHHRLEEQEETIQKHEEILKKLISIRQQQVRNMSPSPVPKVVQRTQEKKSADSCEGGVCALPTAFQNLQPRAQEVVAPKAVVAIVTSMSQSETERTTNETLPTITELTEENLDEELKDELSELKETSDKA